MRYTRERLVLAWVGLALMVSACAVAPDPGAGADAPAPEWTLVWQDTFDGDTLDRTKWAPEQSCWGGGNDERQCYTDRPDNVAVHDGVLHLKARLETFRGPLHPVERRSADDGLRTQNYTSGKVRTRGLADWRYGRISARMKLPAGQGAWPAFWMMPAHDQYGSWPLSGEIDIMEAVNLKTPCAGCAPGIETRTSGALHFGGLPPDNTYWFAKAPESDGATPADEWRVYTVEWAQGQIQWFVDGDIFLRINAEDWFTAAVTKEQDKYAPFNQPFYLMFNLAVGGRLPELENKGGFDPAAFPAELLVDWVRVEQCNGDLETGRACLSDVAWQGDIRGPWEPPELEG